VISVPIFKKSFSGVVMYRNQFLKYPRYSFVQKSSSTKMGKNRIIYLDNNIKHSLNKIFEQPFEKMNSNDN